VKMVFSRFVRLENSLHALSAYLPHANVHTHVAGKSPMFGRSSPSLAKKSGSANSSVCQSEFPARHHARGRSR